MPILRSHYKAGENEALAVAENIERADGFTYKEIKDAMDQARDRYQTIVMAA